MKQDIAQQWVAALRSGKYKRGIRALKTNDGGHCCLGVLCDLHSATGDGHWAPAKTPGDKPYYNTPDSRNCSSAYLTDVVRVWAGIDNSSPAVPYECDAHTTYKISLAEVNDMTPPELGFDEIANLIEKHWETI